MNRPLDIQVSDLARAQIRAAEDWWRGHRTKAPNAIREELERACSLIAIQPDSGAHARNISLPGVRRLHLARVRYYLYYFVRAEDEQIDILALWHESRGHEPSL